jgi:hypothetical protein
MGDWMRLFSHADSHGVVYGGGGRYDGAGNCRGCETGSSLPIERDNCELIKLVLRDCQSAFAVTGPVRVRWTARLRCTLFEEAIQCNRDYHLGSDD